MPKAPPPSADRPEGDRIAKLLARAGVAQVGVEGVPVGGVLEADTGLELVLRG